jgi:hypothetical protein
MLCINALALSSQQPATSSAAPQAADQEDRIKPGTVVQAEMATTVDVKKAHSGDLFQAKVWNDVWGQSGIILPHGTTIVGHVLDCQPRSKDNPESKLVVTLDKAILKDGAELPLRGVVERVELSAAAAAAAQDDSTVDMSGAARHPGSTRPGTPAGFGPFSAPNDRSPGGQPLQLKKKPPSPFAPSGVVDRNISAKGDATGRLTELSSTKTDVKLQSHATIDVCITRAGE